MMRLTYSLALALSALASAAPSHDPGFSQVARKAHSITMQQRN